MIMLERARRGLADCQDQSMDGLVAGRQSEIFKGDQKWWNNSAALACIDFLRGDRNRQKRRDPLYPQQVNFDDLRALRA